MSAASEAAEQHDKVIGGVILAVIVLVILLSGSDHRPTQAELDAQPDYCTSYDMSTGGC